MRDVELHERRGAAGGSGEGVERRERVVVQREVAQAMARPHAGRAGGEMVVGRVEALQCS